MGRIWETRKTTMMARWDRMAKAFARCGKEITIAVKTGGGPIPGNNPSLRRALQNARAVNMPKEKIDAAIKKASGQADNDYEIVMYEGYAPHGIALMVETATDNVTRTVANVRLAFKDYDGNFGAAGSVAFMFQKMGVFRLAHGSSGGLDLESLELELIDHGLQEMGESKSDKGEPQVVIRCAFSDFGALQAGIEARGLTVISAESEYVPQNLVEIAEDKANDVFKLIDALEQDDDVQRVYHNMA
jgi:YebC/PmpR family DNA-binding regulatory protein